MSILLFFFSYHLHKESKLHPSYQNLNIIIIIITHNNNNNNNKWKILLTNFIELSQNENNIYFLTNLEY